MRRPRRSSAPEARTGRIGETTDCGLEPRFLNRVLELARPNLARQHPLRRSGTAAAAASPPAAEPDAGDHALAEEARLALGAHSGWDISDDRRVSRDPAGVRPLDVAARAPAVGRGHPAPASLSRSRPRLARTAPAELVCGGRPSGIGLKHRSDLQQPLHTGQAILQPLSSTVPATSEPRMTLVTLNRSSAQAPLGWALPTKRLDMSWFGPAR